jgi:alkaline phosphatase
LILLVCDGWGPLHIEAANQYAGTVPDYQSDQRWTHLWMSTHPFAGSYDGTLAWSSFTYPMSGATDSAAASTAMFAGRKTCNRRIETDPGGGSRFFSLGEHARPLGLALGAITTVPVSHATPGAFTSHNLSRSNGYAIGDEAFFGDPNTTGTTAVDPKYGGGLGPTMPPTDVLVGARGSSWVHPLQRDRLFLESGLPGKHRLVEGEEGVSGAEALLDAAADPTCTMLAGLFDRVTLRVSLPGGGYQLETPSLAVTTTAALTVLERSEAGFALMVEGGSVDWAAHANDMDWTVGELLDFNRAVAAVVAWVDDPANASTWDNTLVVVTGDHETGYLTAAPGVFPDRPLAPGSVKDTTLALEKVELGSGRRASWLDDHPPNDRIDPGETVYWAWNSGDHTNTLIPVFARGVGAEGLARRAVNVDPVRGPYVDNTDLFDVALEVIGAATIFADGLESGDTSRWSHTVLAPG